MSGSVNRVILIGNLGKDPDVRSTQEGRKIVNLSVATAESWKEKGTGERKQRTEWHRVVIFNEGIGKVAEQYLEKGAKVYLEGQLQTRKWTDKEGQEKYTTEIVIPAFGGSMVMLSASPGGRADTEAEEAHARTSTSSQPSSASSSFVEDQEIPF